MAPTLVWLLIYMLVKFDGFSENPPYFYPPLFIPTTAEAAIEGVQASVDALKLLFGGWCLKIEIEISNNIRKYLIAI